MKKRPASKRLKQKPKSHHLKIAIICVAAALLLILLAAKFAVVPQASEPLPVNVTFKYIVPLPNGTAHDTVSFDQIRELILLMERENASGQLVNSVSEGMAFGIMMELQSSQNLGNITLEMRMPDGLFQDIWPWYENSTPLRTSDKMHFSYDDSLAAGGRRTVPIMLFMPGHFHYIQLQARGYLNVSVLSNGRLAGNGIVWYDVERKRPVQPADGFRQGLN